MHEFHVQKCKNHRGVGGEREIEERSGDSEKLWQLLGFSLYSCNTVTCLIPQFKSSADMTIVTIVGTSLSNN